MKKSFSKLLMAVLSVVIVVCSAVACDGGEHTTHRYKYTVTTKATCETEGSKHGVCSCGEETDVVIPALGHKYGEDGICKNCKQPAYRYSREGDKIYFGSYPQTQVKDDALIAKLNTLTGPMPTSVSAGHWTDYGYYISGQVQSYMWYIDVTEGEDRYRGVYFISYRPYLTGAASNTGNTLQDESGYKINTVHWFKFEPIEWQLLMENDGVALLLCEMVIDSQDFNHSKVARKEDEKTIYANNYAESSIRAWLNDNFYNTAFDEFQKQIILTTEIDNSAATTGYSTNKYACENTSDNIFLLSYTECMFTAYAVRKVKKVTDYGKSQGCNYILSGANEGCAPWWLRSPYNGAQENIRYVSRADGVIKNDTAAYNSNYGTVPALRITL